jgi:vitamin B12 transporter
MRKIIFVFAFASAWLSSVAQKDSLSTKTLDEVVVTATKFEKKQSETGKVLLVIDEEQIKRSAGKDLSQLLNEQAGVVVNGANSNPAKDKSVYLQGAGNAYTLILLDGIPVSDPSDISGGAFDLRLLSLDQVARIEILKGSQSTLYGTNAIAGVINIITKKNASQPFNGFASVNYGSYNTFKGSAGISGTAKSFDYSIGYNRYQTDGISEAKDPTGKNNFDKDGLTQNSFQSNFGIRPTDKLSITPFLRYNTFDGKYDAGAFTDDKVSNYQSKLLNVGTGASYQLKSGMVNFLFGSDQTDRTYKSVYGTNDYKGRFNQVELFLNHDITKNLQVLAGISRQGYKMLDTTSTEKNPKANLISPYLSLFLHDDSGLSLELGGRYNQHSIYGNTFTYSLNPSYFIQKQTKLFFNYSTGFKAPSLNQLFGQYGANPNLKAEQSRHIEAGVQWFSSDKRFNVRAVTFNRKINNVIIYSSGGKYLNFDEQNDRGLEIEPSWKVNSKFTFKASYAFVTGDVTTKVAGKDTTYNNLVRRPKNSFGINIGYQVNPSFFMSLNFRTVGQRSDIYFDLNTFTNQSATLASYQLLDVYAEYKWLANRLTFFVNAKNMLNQDYQEVYGYSTMKFNVMAGVNARLK